MKKFKYIIPLILISLVFIGASCEKGSSPAKSESEFAYPFEGDLTESKITDNSLGDNNPKISGDGQTIVYFKDTEDENNYIDSIGIAGPNGEKGVIKIVGGLLPEKSGLMIDSLDISRDGSKVAFIAAPFVENWWSTWPMFKYVYVLDLKAETLAKIDPQELPEKFYKDEADAERAEPVRVALSDDGSMVAFTVNVWGVDFDSIHDAWGGDDNMLLIAPSDGSKEPDVLKMGIAEAHVDMDSEGRIFYCKTDNENHSKYELSVINSDGSGNKGLGINIGSWGLVASNNGRVVAFDKDKGTMFVASHNGNIIAQTENYYGSVNITGDGSKVLVYQGNNKLPKEENGLVFYNVDDGFSVDQILEHRGYKISSNLIDVSDHGEIVVFQSWDEDTDRDYEITSIYWKK